MAMATERFNDLCKANAESAQQYTLFALEGAERLFRQQAETARGWYAESTRQVLDVLCGDASKGLAQWPRLLERNMERSVEIARACINGMTEFQGELADLVRDQLPAINRSLIHSMEQFSQMAAQSRSTKAETTKQHLGEAEHRAKKMAA